MGGKRSYWAALAAIGAFLSTQTYAQDSSVILQLNRVVTYSTDKPFTKAVPGNTRILDIVPVTDHEVVLQPQAVGSTNILFLDPHGLILANIDVRVDDPVEIGRHGVELHNDSSKLGNAAYYRCSTDGCVLADETIMRSTPAAAPPQQTITQSVREAPSQAPTAAAPAK
jgi:hypothetical protein